MVASKKGDESSDLLAEALDSTNIPADLTPVLDLPAEEAEVAAPAKNRVSASGVEDSIPELTRQLHLDVRVELGRRRMPLRDVLRLQSGSVLELDRGTDEPVDLYVNDILLARGEILVLNNCFCVRVTEVLPTPGSSHGEGA